MIQEIITIPKTITFKTNHITEEEMKAKYINISSWLSDQNGIIEVTVLEKENLNNLKRDAIMKCETCTDYARCKKHCNLGSCDD